MRRVLRTHVSFETEENKPGTDTPLLEFITTGGLGLRIKAWILNRLTGKFAKFYVVKEDKKS